MGKFYWNVIYNTPRIEAMKEAFSRAERMAAGDADAVRRIRYMRKIQIGNLELERDKYLKRTESISNFCEEFNAGHPAVVYLQPMKYTGRPYPKTMVTVRDLGQQLEFTFDCEEPEMEQMIASKRADDDSGIWQDCEVELLINPSGDRINYYHFMLNVCGSFYDAKGMKTGAKSQGNSKWNSNAVHTITRGEKSWKAVILLDKAVCGNWNPEGFVVNFNRSRAIKNKPHELYSWSPFLLQGFHELDRFGRLTAKNPSAGNIINTGSFRSKYWYRWGGWQPNQQKPGQFRGHDPLTFVFGDKSLKISYTGKEGEKFRSNVGQALYDIKPNTRYRLSFYMKLENVRKLGKSGGAGLQIWNTSKNFWFPARYHAGNMPWTQFSFEFKSLPNTNPKTTLLNCNLFYSTGTAWFDGISMVEIKD